MKCSDEYGCEKAWMVAWAQDGLGRTLQRRIRPPESYVDRARGHHKQAGLGWLDGLGEGQPRW